MHGNGQITFLLVFPHTNRFSPFSFRKKGNILTFNAHPARNRLAHHPANPSLCPRMKRIAPKETKKRNETRQKGKSIFFFKKKNVR